MQREYSPYSMQNQSSSNKLWWQWVLATVIGELVGFTVVAVVSAIAQIGDILAMNAVILIAGIIEGLSLGTAQWVVLRHHLTHANWWIPATAGGAFLAWILGLLPNTVIESQNRAIAVIEPSLPDLLGFATVMGAVLGLVFGWLQWLVLRVDVPHARSWIWVNAIAWACGLMVAFLGTSLVQAGDDVSQIAMIGSLTGIGMGIVVSAITGVALVRLMRKRVEL